ncbi:MAG: LPS translocon maturation chaperone LptM [Sphingomonadaceae bacterium]|jgi:predicted small lipoprotein YifL
MRTALLVVLSAAFAVAGCGQKGPLYLRESPPPGVKPKKPEPYQPVPYPQHPASDGAAEQR